MRGAGESTYDSRAAMAKSDMTSKAFREGGLQIRTGQRERGHDYKAELLDQLAQAGLPEPVKEFKFHAERGWRYDYAWPDLKVAAEYQGGVFDEGRSGHTSKGGVLRDVEKLNESQAAGWHVVYVTPNTVVNRVALRYIKNAIARATDSVTMGTPEAQVIKDAVRTLRGLGKGIETVVANLDDAA